jgi:hypothetical protein
MKKITNLWILGIIAGAGLTSCQKNFDPSTYKPKLTINGYNYTRQVAASNLVAYWAFDGNNIDSVSKAQGTAVGTSFSPGVINQALQGADKSYMVTDAPSAVQALTSFTVTAWVHAPQNSNGQVGIIDVANTKSMWGNLTIYFDNGGTATSGNLKVHLNNNGAEAVFGSFAVTNPWDKWINIAVSYDETASTLKVYVNGSVLATKVMANYGALHFQNATKIVFGTLQFQTMPSLTSAANAQPSASYLTGQLDEIRMYNRALSDVEISTIVKLQNHGK